MSVRPASPSSRSSRLPRPWRTLTVVAASLAALGITACRQFPETQATTDLARQGRDIFRDDTFGDEQFWTDTARLHEVIENGIQPLEALDLGLKVDMDRLNLAKF